MHPFPHTSQRGNVLFLILIAVALYAALSYAVTSSSLGSGTDISEDKAKLGASEFAQYIGALRSEVQRLMISGCAIENLDFRHSFWMDGAGTAYAQSGGNSPTTAPSPKSGCSVFTTFGGRVPPRNFMNLVPEGMPVGSGTPYIAKAGDAVVRWVSKLNEGTSALDVAFIVAGISPKVCAAMLDITTSGLNSENISGGGTCAFNCSEPGVVGMSYRIDSGVNIKNEYFATTNTGVTTPANCNLGAILISR